MNQSLWISESQGRRFKPLQENIETHIIIIGGGMVGVNTAYLLSKEGLDVTLIDSNQIGYGTSGMNTGKLTPQSGLVYAKIKKMYGMEKLKEFYKANQEALAFIQKTIKDYNIDCDFDKVPSYLFTEQLSKINSFEEEYKVYEELGIEGQLVNRLDLPLNIKIGLSQVNARVFNPKKYIDGLVPVLLKQGVNIYEDSPITHMNKASGGWELDVADKFKVKANHVVLASHYPFYDNFSFYVTRLRPEASYIVAGEYEKDFPNASFLCIDDPIRSFRTYEDEGKRWLLIGGDNHKVGQDNADHYEALMQYGNNTFGLSEYQYKWRAQCYKTPDEVPYIGYLNEHSDSNNIYVATGFNKWGNINSMIAAKKITELIVEKKESDEGVYDPSRSKDYFTSTYIKENSNTVFEWIKSKVGPLEQDLPKKRETAYIVKLDGKRYGAYLDKRGEMHIVDITCPHMGAELNWNQVDKTWDCPCHGSRFSIDGDVVEGPATYKLNKYGEKGNTVDPEILQS